MPTIINQNNKLVFVFGQANEQNIEEFNHPKVSYRGATSRIIRKTFLEAGFQIDVSNSKFNVCWGNPKTNQFIRQLSPFQVVNHLPGEQAITHKDLLSITITQQQQMFPKDYNFIPVSFSMPESTQILLDDMKNHPKQIYVYKTAMGARGEGVKLLKSGDKFNTKQAAVVQHYLMNPLLVNGYKFDLRVYVIVTSIDPLAVYVFNEGLARFATEEWKKPNQVNIQHKTMHLTNYSVNKKSATFQMLENNDEISTDQQSSKEVLTDKEQNSEIFEEQNESECENPQFLKLSQNVNEESDLILTGQNHQNKKIEFQQVLKLNNQIQSQEKEFNKIGNVSGRRHSELQNISSHNMTSSLQLSNLSQINTEISSQFRSSRVKSTIQTLKLSISDISTNQSANQLPLQHSLKTSSTLPQLKQEPITQPEPTIQSVIQTQQQLKFNSKWAISELFKYLDVHPEIFDQSFVIQCKTVNLSISQYLYNQLHQLVRRTLIASYSVLVRHQVETHTNVLPRKTFGFYGFDVMIMRSGELKLIEVNVNPATGTDTKLDLKLKSQLIIDTMNLVGVNCQVHNNGVVVPKYNKQTKAHNKDNNQKAQQKGEMQGTYSKAIVVTNAKPDYTDYEKACVNELVLEQQRCHGFTRVFPCSDDNEQRLIGVRIQINRLAHEEMKKLK